MICVLEECESVAADPITKYYYDAIPSRELPYRLTTYVNKRTIRKRLNLVTCQDLYGDLKTGKENHIETKRR